MLVSFVFAAILVGLAAAVGVVQSNLALGLVCSLLAVATIGTAISIRGEALGRLQRIFSPAVLFVLLVPCFWMLLQAAPMPLGSLSNSVWSSTANALRLPGVGSITIDTGATLIAFTQYWAALATTIIAAAFTFDRRLAEITLYFLTAIAALAAALRIVSDIRYFDLVDHAVIGRNQGMSTVAAIGITLSCAVAIRLRERLLDKRNSRQARWWLFVGLVAAAAALVICTIAVFNSADIKSLFASFFGAETLIGIFVIRKWFLGAWGRVGILAIGVMMLFAFLIVPQTKRNADSANEPSSVSMATDRMLADAPVLGSGAGTFEELLPIYSQLGETRSRGSQVAADVLSIEMGRTFLWISILALVLVAVMFTRAALSRGRDYVYPGAGAGGGVAILILIFINGDALGLAASIFASVAIGLAWAQSRSTTGNTAFSARPSSGTTGGLLRAENTFLRSDEPRKRLAFALVGLVLTTEAAWVLLAERHASAVVSSPLVEAHPAVSIEYRNRLYDGATIAALRGDLWAESAFAGSTLLLNDPAASSGDDRTRGDLTRALRYAPYRSDVWLTFAALAQRFKWAGCDPRALLKMAYYTGPNEASLIPARLKAAFQLSGTAADPDLRDLIKRDVSLIIRNLPALKPALADAYKSASPDGRTLEESLIAELDPGYLKTIRMQ